MAYLNPAVPSLPFSDFETSRDAAIRMQPHASTQRERYFDWLSQRGGGTDAEAHAELGMRISSVNARRNELVKLGRVVRTAGRRNGGAIWLVKE